MWRRSQVAKAEVCKTSIQRFESARRLHSRPAGAAGAGVAELGDAADLKSAGPLGSWGFDSPPRHQQCGELQRGRRSRERPGRWRRRKVQTLKVARKTFTMLSEHRTQIL